MFKKYLTVILAILIVNMSLGSVAFGQTTQENDEKLTIKVKKGAAKLGTGKTARVDVELKDGRKLKGYISQIGENGFSVINEKTSVITDISFTNVKVLKGHQLSYGIKLVIGVGILVAAFIIVGIARIDE